MYANCIGVLILKILSMMVLWGDCWVASFLLIRDVLYDIFRGS